LTRFFFAVTPDEPLRNQIELFRGRWGHPHHKVEPHITIKAPFLWQGDPVPVLQAAQYACQEIAPFDVLLGRPAQFPKSHVLYLTVISKTIAQLHHRVVEAIAPLLPTDARGHEGMAFTPHLTLAAGRFGIDVAGLAEMERKAAIELVNLTFQVTALRCYRWGDADTRWQPYIDLPLQTGYNGMIES
jgi:2'-5' RNA ligase